MSARDDLQELLQFFYQCPVGLLQITDGGAVEKINPGGRADARLRPGRR